MTKLLTQTCSFILIKVVSVSTHTKVGANCIYTHLFTTMLFCSTFINICKYKKYFFRTFDSVIWISDAVSSFFFFFENTSFGLPLKKWIRWSQCWFNLYKLKLLYVILFVKFRRIGNCFVEMLVWDIPFLLTKATHCRRFQ